MALASACERAERAPVDRAGRDVGADGEADSLFLRRMLEHHAALTSIVHAAAERKDGVAVREEAHLIDLRHDVGDLTLLGSLARMGARLFEALSLGVQLQ